MGIMEIIGIAGSVSLLAGWRLYLCIFATGLAMRLDVLPLPEHLASLSVLGNPWVLAIAAFGALAEFFADKVMWLDSAWDTLHTLIRPVGGALLALAIVDPSDPATQVVAFLLGGGASFLAHGGKASARAVVNASPEPVSNVVASSAEDVATVGLLWLAYEYPLAAGGIALVLLVLALSMLWLARKIVRRVFFRTPEVGR
ncbi:MAG: DUF4126 domain-containing protein [Pseudomonadota bacterium]|uniref:DUF4126 domain-containing protein n=1 Tax=Qipengyuania flava TaxID=192812 RepID=UPI0007F3A493|nr:DUF4126 domain-containing protein [Qipengyuania flava]MEC7161480.1 DUF4126 domain-containing protein [Pseudomonadota bacterium]OAN83851.1 hypothetical protein A8B77_06465 [Erythrobacter sp. EhN03]ASP28868.1 DUF4126 domain-containing protein [Qipengyuania flava]MEC7625278.1 DUF4126 domain-containing protein [Pseudomonadota bacterium]MEC7742348.1 DUF4126 domain-containing protein [Pseudomonadota bacterium]